MKLHSILTAEFRWTADRNNVTDMIANENAALDKAISIVCYKHSRQGQLA